MDMTEWSNRALTSDSVSGNMAMFHSRNSMPSQLTFKSIQQTLLFLRLNNIMYIIYILQTVCNHLLLCNIVN